MSESSEEKMERYKNQPVGQTTPYLADGPRQARTWLGIIAGVFFALGAFALIMGLDAYDEYDALLAFDAFYSFVMWGVIPLTGALIISGLGKRETPVTE